LWRGGDLNASIILRTPQRTVHDVKVD